MDHPVKLTQLADSYLDHIRTLSRREIERRHSVTSLTIGLALHLKKITIEAQRTGWSGLTIRTPSKGG